ncbi:hypothetical protein [Legionella resiliens]|uniref:Uncharacterized protein n=1 Tax=Legionella resiliens TaxID=2905958 RepID=A0ABS8X1X9_9GAMM|nr:MULTISPECIES: hypothetical protein [unclassified Legionella]MCE0723589.1 hypothetical protein [Legionella sp. 9fVS26]MCE3532743.1 hypothetical protein [Legionella sp. 8cVS16]
MITPPKTLLPQFFAEQGCLIRMIGGAHDATEKESLAIQDIEDGALYNRPSSFITKNVSVTKKRLNMNFWQAACIFYSMNLYIVIFS